MTRRRSLWPPPDAGIEAELGRGPQPPLEVGTLEGVAQRRRLDRLRLRIDDLVQLHAPGALDLAHASLEGELEVAPRPGAVQARGHAYASLGPGVALEQVEDGSAQDEGVAPRRREGRPIALAQPRDHSRPVEGGLPA